MLVYHLFVDPNTFFFTESVQYIPLSALDYIFYRTAYNVYATFVLNLGGHC